MKALTLFALLMAITVTYTKSQPIHTLWKADGHVKLGNKSKSPAFALDIPSLKSLLQKASAKKVNQQFQNSKPIYIQLPLPDGSLKVFSISEISVFSKQLQQKFPSIKTYRGTHEDGYTTAWLTFSPKGIHATIFGKNGLVNVEKVDEHPFSNRYSSHYSGKAPVSQNNYEHAAIEMATNTYSPTEQPISHATNESISLPSRIFRIAIAATGEYTQFHGGTKADAMNAIASTLATVNAIYERELSIRFELVANNDLLIFTDSITDPYTNGVSSVMLTENQATINSIIGEGNYDIGHLFSTDGGGLAYQASACSPLKAGGVSTAEIPKGAFFDIALVAHEIAHQFGAHHTHNGPCNRFAETAYEPASGSTIMSYAGACPPNIQSLPDPYFHHISLLEILDFVESNACGQTIETDNQAPIIATPAINFNIPAQTPFLLTSSASDPDGDSLTYCWEQFDLADNNAGRPPLFRSLPPNRSSARYFPNLQSLAANTPSPWEKLPTENAIMNFRLTVRDNHEGGGALAYATATVNALASAGPFTVTSPNTPVSWLAGVPQVVKWKVANTKQQPINCQSVHILLSTDGGLTYPDTLAKATENDGEATIVLPALPTDAARIKVVAADNIFFNINPSNFSIRVATTPSFVLTALPEELTLCSPINGEVQLITTALQGFNQPIELAVNELPPGMEANFSQNTALPNDTLQLTLTTENILGNDSYPLIISGNAEGINSSDTIQLHISVTPPLPPILISPTAGQRTVSIRPTFNWQRAKGKASFFLELALNPDFSNILYTSPSLLTNRFIPDFPLEGNTNYYWRVRAANACGVGSFSAVDSFSTVAISCQQYASTDIPINISATGTPVISSQIPVENRAIITDLQLNALSIDHSYISDLTVSLRAPSSLSATLFSEICGDNDQLSLSFSSASELDTIACPPNDGRSYLPIDSFTFFHDSLSQGIWTLVVEDRYNLDGGTLNGWSLQICTTPLPFNVKALGLAPDKVAINWDDIVEDEQSFIVERAQGTASSFTAIDTLAANNNIFIDEGLSSNTSYRYRIRILYLDGGFSLSNEAEIQTLPQIPAAPSRLQGNPLSQTEISLGWQDNAETESGFLLERSFPDSTFFQLIDTLPANSTTFLDSGLIAASTYYYRIRAFNQTGNSLFSPTLSISTFPFAPKTPFNLTASLTAYNQVALSWEISETNHTFFIIERSAGDTSQFNAIASVSSEILQFIDVDLSPSSTFYYRIRAGNDGGESEPTWPVSIETLPKPPNAPEVFIGNVASLSSIQLRWEDTSDNELGFIIEKSIGNGNAFQFLDSLDANMETYLDTSLTTNTAYFYRIKSYNAGGHSAFSNLLSITIFPAAPNAPSSLRATDITQESLKLSWQDNANNELGFYVERQDQADSEFLPIDTLPPNQNFYFEQGLVASSQYLYRIRAFNTSGQSAFTNPIAITTLPFPPVAPTNLTLEKASQTQVNLFWQDNADNETGFIIERATGNSGFEEIATTVANRTVFSDIALTIGEDYFYRVAATNSGGSSDYSNQISTITVDLPTSEQPIFSIYPNPFEGTFFHVSIPQSITGSLHFSLVDALGKSVWQQQKSVASMNQSNTLAVTVGQTPSGFYQLMIETNEGVFIFPLIKR